MRDVGIHRHRVFDTRLTPREMAVAQLVGQCCSNGEIARKMGWVIGTAENYVNLIFRKMGYQRDPRFNHRVRLAFWAREHPDDPNVADQWGL